MENQDAQLESTIITKKTMTDPSPSSPPSPPSPSTIYTDLINWINKLEVEEIESHTKILRKYGQDREIAGERQGVRYICQIIRTHLKEKIKEFS